jgi:plastin-1
MQSVNAQGAEVSDSQLDSAVLAWARQRLAASGRTAHQLSSFSDQSVETGLFLIDLLAAVEPASINYRIVAPGTTPEERELNARLVISAARKIGCSLPIVWDDIAEARNPKVILAFIAAVLVHATKS